MMATDSKQQLIKNIFHHLNQHVLGQEWATQQVLMTVLCQGHALLTGSPGLAKTTLVRTLALALGQSYKRIQFTPDLTPYDILGGDTLAFESPSGDTVLGKRLVFAPGPIFSHFVLADEINRASPRTQSALLEAMQERTVTLNGVTHGLPDPFYVFATQNPIENEGTFPLPEAQLDRFLCEIVLDYPSFETEVQIAHIPSHSTTSVQPFPDAQVLFTCREDIQNISVDPLLVQAIVRLVRNTRPQDTSLAMVKDNLAYGASPRASQALLLLSRCYAFLQDQKEVTPDMIQKVAPSVLAHRCVLSFAALSSKMTARHIIDNLLKETVL